MPPSNRQPIADFLWAITMTGLLIFFGLGFYAASKEWGFFGGVISFLLMPVTAVISPCFVWIKWGWWWWPVIQVCIIICGFTSMGLRPKDDE